MIMTDENLVSIADVSLSNESDDLLGHKHLARILLEYLRAETREVRTIGLIGAWGSGKSSIKNLAIERLNGNADVKTVEFNAWRHGGSDVQRAFFRELYLSLGGDQKHLDRALFSSHEQERSAPDISWGNLKESLIDPSAILFGAWALIVCVVAGVAWGVLAWSTDFGHEALFVSAIWIAIGLLWPVAISLYKFIMDPMRLTPLLQEKITVRQGPISAAEQYEVKLHEQLEKAENEFDHLVIFVDDIDRLRSEGAIHAIEAIRTFLDMPDERLESLPSMTFVISVDEVRLGTILESELKGRSAARDYVTRLFQLRVEIPPAPTRDLRSFAEESIREDKVLSQKLDEQNVWAVVLDRLVTEEIDTPREVVRLANRFIQAAWLARTRESDDLTEPGLIAEGHVTNELECLAAAVALSERFPEFVRELQQHSGIRIQFAAKYAMDESTELPNPLQDQVEKYRTLKRYLKSLYGLRWPNHESTFFRLAEDPFSREHGDLAKDVRQALSANDLHAARNLLGAEGKRRLGYKEVQILEAVLTEMETEGGVRAENTVRTALQLLSQVPPESRTPICQALLSTWRISKRLRYSVSLVEPLKAFQEVSDEFARRFLEPVIEDLVAQDTELTGERTLDEICDELQKWAPAALRLAVDSTSFRASMSRFIREPTVNVDGETHRFRWEDVLSWFEKNEAVITSFLGEFFAVFENTQKESGLDRPKWEQAFLALDSVDEPMIDDVIHLPSYASSEDLPVLIRNAENWIQPLRETMLVDAEIGAKEGELSTRTLEVLADRAEIFEDCLNYDIPNLFVLAATSDDLDSRLFEFFAQKGSSFPTASLLENFEALKEEAVQTVAARLTENDWKAAQRFVLDPLLKSAPTDNHLRFLEHLPPGAPPFQKAGVSRFSKRISSNANDLEWLTKREEILTHLRKRGSDTTLREHIFQGLEQCAKGSQEENAAALLRTLIGISSLSEDEVATIEKVATNAPCPPLIDMVLDVDHDMRPDTATEWLIKAWATSQDIAEHSFDDGDFVERLSKEEFSHFLENHPNNGKSKSVYVEWCRADLNEGLNLFGKVPRKHWSSYGRLLWDNVQAETLLKGLSAEEISDEVTAAIVGEWSGATGNIEAITAVTESSNESVAKIIVKHIVPQEFADTPRKKLRLLVRALRKQLGDDAKLDRLASVWDVKGAGDAIEA